LDNKRNEGYILGKLEHTVNSRYLKFQGTVGNSLRYPKFELTELKDNLCKSLETKLLHDDR